MIKKTVYEAGDGTLFDTEEEAQDHEADCANREVLENIVKGWGLPFDGGYSIVDDIIEDAVILAKALEAYL